MESGNLVSLERQKIFYAIKGDYIFKLYKPSEGALEDLQMGFRDVAKPLKLGKIIVHVCVHVFFSEGSQSFITHLFLKGKVAKMC